MHRSVGSPIVSPPPLTANSRTLSESSSKALLASFDIPVVAERLVSGREEVATAADALGLPLVAKLCGDAIAHKTERGLVRLNLGDVAATEAAVTELLAAARPEDGEVAVLLAPMVAGNRELIAGMSRDPQFGPTVLVGVGGIIAEALGDVSIRLVPVDPVDVDEMLDDLASQALLGPFRGEPPLDRQAMRAVVLGLSRLAIERPDVRSVDLNPLIVSSGRPIAVDALVEVDT